MRTTHEVIVRLLINGHESKEVTYKAREMSYEDLIEVLQLVTDQLGFADNIEDIFDQADIETVAHLREQLAAAEEAAFLQEGGPTYVGSQMVNAPEGVYRINYKSGHSHITMVTNSNGDKELIVVNISGGYGMFHINDSIPKYIEEHISSIQFLRPL